MNDEYKNFKDFIDAIKATSNIAGIVSEYVPLKEKDGVLWGRCPFCRGNSVSLVVRRNTGLFYCYGCQIGGNAFTFIQNLNKCSFKEAAKLLAVKCGISPPKE